MSSDPSSGAKDEADGTDLFGKLDSLIQKHQGRSARRAPEAVPMLTEPLDATPILPPADVPVLEDAADLYLPSAEAQVWKPRNKPKPAAAVKRPAAKARPRPTPTPAATVKPAVTNNGARPVDLVPDDEDDRGSSDRADRDVRVVRDAEPARSSGNDRRVGDTEVFVVIND